MNGPGIWLVYAVAAAIVWGLSYVLTEQLLKNISLAAVILWGSVGSMMFATCLGFATGSFKQDRQVLVRGGKEMWLLLAFVATYIVANLLIVLSIKAKNATMAGMIEITYPLFTVFFAWLLFRESQLTLGTLLGTGLIMAGVACIYFLDSSL